MHPIAAINYRLAFALAPISLVLSSNRSIVDCNTRLCEMFAQSRELLIGLPATLPEARRVRTHWRA